MTEKRHAQFLCRLIIRIKTRMIDVAPADIRHQVRRLEAEVLHAAAQLVGHLFRTAGRRHGDREKYIFMPLNEFFNPVVVPLCASESQAADVFCGDVDAGGEEDLLVETFLLDVVKAKLHVVAGDMARGNLTVTPVHFGIVNIRMAMRRAALGIARIELMNPLGIMISALAGFLRREARVGLGEIINFIHEITFTQMGIQIDNHRVLLCLGLIYFPPNIEVNERSIISSKVNFFLILPVRNSSSMTTGIAFSAIWPLTGNESRYSS